MSSHARTSVKIIKGQILEQIAWLIISELQWAVIPRSLNWISFPAQVF